jgi:hypothetical protein
VNFVDQAYEQLEQLSSERLDAVRGLLEGWRMVVPGDGVTVSVVMAQSVVNGWLLTVLPDRFVAGESRLIAGGDIWCVSVGIAYPRIGIVGEVGEVLVSAFSGGIISATRPEQMKVAGLKCYAEQESAIQAYFLKSSVQQEERDSTIEVLDNVEDVRYDFSDLVGRLSWRGDAIAVQRKLRDESEKEEITRWIPL